MQKKVENLWNRIKIQTKKEIGKIFGENYKVWVINTKSDALLYHWANWKNLLPEINKLLELTTENAFIRSFQAFENENKWLGFGRMSWSTENNKKWTTKYRTSEYQDNVLMFLGTEIWAPDWNHCYNKGESPAVYIKVYHNFKMETIKEGIIIAIPKSLVKKNETQIKSSLESLNRIIPNSTMYQIERNWTPTKEFVNRIEDLNPQELEKILNSCA
jgi:coproporphyrinogen III oxidase-like Fe-S oxidoreductase